MRALVENPTSKPSGEIQVFEPCVSGTHFGPGKFSGLVMRYLGVRRNSIFTPNFNILTPQNCFPPNFVFLAPKILTLNYLRHLTGQCVLGRNASLKPFPGSLAS
jgi:hypothetical protein